VTPEELRQLGEENERQSAAWQAIWREGYLAAAAQFEAIEAAGYARAISEVKRAQDPLREFLREVFDEVDAMERRWQVRGEPRTRKPRKRRAGRGKPRIRTRGFGDPHKDDYPGREAA
jgi:hypothetical protein